MLSRPLESLAIFLESKAYETQTIDWQNHYPDIATQENIFSGLKNEEKFNFLETLLNETRTKKAVLFNLILLANHNKNFSDAIFNDEKISDWLLKNIFIQLKDKDLLYCLEIMRPIVIKKSPAIFQMILDNTKYFQKWCKLETNGHLILNPL